MGKQSLTKTLRLRDYLTLVRVPNCVMIGIAVVVGETIALGTLPSIDKTLPGFLTASLMMAGTMVMNDLYDLQIDKINSPNRPIASGRVRPGEALAFLTTLSLASIFFALFLGPFTLLTALLALVLMAYYNTRGKRTGLPGNIIVSFNVALPFFYGGLAVSSLVPPVLIFSALAFVANLGREVAKGIPDLEGDRSLCIRTVAVSHGPKVAARVSAVLFMTAVILSVLPPILGEVSVLYFPGVILADIGFAFSSIALVANAKPLPVRRVKNWVLLWMLLGLVGFLLGGLAR